MYFFHAWGLSGKSLHEREELHQEADSMLAEMTGRYQTHAVFRLMQANSDGDDLLLEGFRLPLLRQQHQTANVSQTNLCLADFVRPLSQGIPDLIGVFAATVDETAVSGYADDDYRHMLAQTLADRLAEATVEHLHEQVRKHYWGYAPDEQLSVEEMLREDFQGIRPAVGYPSLPDMSLNFLLDELLDMKQIGIRLTESGMMCPHASVSGLMLAHPQARYFEVGRIGDDQLADYAQRRGMPVDVMRKFVRG